MVTDVCTIYLTRMRRHVYVTPKSYLSFIALYKDIYLSKYGDLASEESNIRKGLERLAEAAEGIKELQINLEEEKKEQKIAADATKKLLDKLAIENAKASKKEAECNKIKEGCEDQASKITVERKLAQADLDKAMPFVHQAVSAANEIDPKDIKSLSTTSTPVDTTKIIMDVVNIIFQRPLDPCTANRGKKIGKHQFDWLDDSYETQTKITLKHQ